MVRRRRNRFKFTEKVHSKKGIAALVIAGFCLIMLVVILTMAFKNAGELSLYYGSAGVFLTLVSIVAFILAIQSTKEENSFMLFPRLATAFSGISCVCWIGLYVLGFTL